jgi:hypothetical protein
VRPALATALLGLAACAAPPDTLQGSLDEVAPLAFQTVAVRVNPSILVVEYQFVPKGGGAEVPLKMVVTPPDGVPLANGVKINLAEFDVDGNPRAVCSRSAADDPRTRLPPIKLGELDLTSNFAPGSTATGTFHILFGEGGDIGEGRTVDGTFSVTASDPNPDGNNP